MGDHKYVKCILSLDNLTKQNIPPKSNSPYWKLNSSILKDEDFLENFAVMYGKLQAKIQDYPDIADWWDLCAKPSIKKLLYWGFKSFGTYQEKYQTVPFLLLKCSYETKRLGGGG